MIVVTGAKRSGTSLWMQILMAAGFQQVGSAFPLKWKESIGDANPEGFYESLLRRGIYHRTNPHPHTGQYIFPEKSRDLVVKVFVPGLIRSDRSFLDRVIGTIRPWREQCASVLKLAEGEDRWVAQRREARGEPPRAPRRSPYPPEVTWWYDNYRLVRDVATRRYPYHLVSYGSLVEEPAITIARALRFVGRGDLSAACGVVRPGLYRNRAAGYESQLLGTQEIEIFDQLYDTIHNRRPLDATLLKGMNEVQAGMLARFLPRPLRKPE